ncbi:membrane domain protein, partial [Escherichia coli]|nr:membrane domain protein [Escherichia coli]
MSYFYRSKNISGVSINEDSLISLSTAIVERCVKMNEQAQKESREVCAQCVFFILFDGKGYKVDSIGELVKYFRQATRIDQIIFTIETYQSRQSNRMNGSWMELRIDERNSNSSTMIVASEDNEWVDSLWITIQDLLNKCKNKFRFFRTAWTMLSIQISGVTVGFLLSLWTASKLAPKL